MELPINEPKWVEIDVTGKSGIRYSGSFCLKPFLSFAEKADASRLAESYCQGIFRNGGLVDALTYLAYLKFHVIKVSKADWWDKTNGLNLVDIEPINELVDRLNEIVNPVKDEETPSDEK